jgi:hypothetical protein
MGRPHARLIRFEDAFPGFRTETVEGSVLASPVRPFHGRTIQRLRAMVEARLPHGWALVLDSPLGKPTVGTGRLPVDPEAADRA